MNEYQFVEEEKRIVVNDHNENEVGEITFIQSGKNTIIIDHTGVKESHRGQGLAEQLVLKVVNKAKREQLKIIPLCPFAKKEFDLKREYSDVLHK